MIKKSAFTLFFAAVLSVICLPASAQRDGSYQGDIDLTPLRFEQVGDSLYIDMDIALRSVRVGSPLSINFAPCVTTPEHQRSLPVVSVKGRRNYKAYQRSLLLEGRNALTGPGHSTIVVEGYGKEYEVVHYRHVTLYEPWMAEAALDVVRDDTGCGENLYRRPTRLVSQVALENRQPETPVVVVRKEIEPQLVYIVPRAEAVKNRELEAECRLDFVVNRTEINPAYMGNPRELARIRGIIDDLKDDPSITVNRLSILGYASPEGSLANNKRLSEGRATALRDYLAGQYEFPLKAYHISFGGENWDGLVKALETYPLAYKDEVLSIIENTPDAETRKTRLKTLRGGAPYAEMLKNIYPGLRTAICVVEYSIKGFDTNDALEVYKTRPQNLSLNEFYMVAETIPEGSAEFIEVFETAVRMYPSDEVANLNAAVAALENRNKLAAGRYLGNIGESAYTAEYYNARGALAVLNEEYDTARRYFQLAADKGLEAARKNLELLP